MMILIELVRRNHLVEYLVLIAIFIVRDEENPCNQTLATHRANLNQLVDIVLDALDIGWSHLWPPKGCASGRFVL